MFRCKGKILLTIFFSAFWRPHFSIWLATWCLPKKVNFGPCKGDLHMYSSSLMTFKLYANIMHIIHYSIHSFDIPTAPHPSPSLLSHYPLCAYDCTWRLGNLIQKAFPKVSSLRRQNYYGQDSFCKINANFL